MRIRWKNEQIGGTPIPKELWGFLCKLAELGYIKKDQPINAEFFNKYHPEELLEEYKNGKDIDKIGLIFTKE